MNCRETTEAPSGGGLGLRARVTAAKSSRIKLLHIVHGSLAANPTTTSWRLVAIAALLLFLAGAPATAEKIVWKGVPIAVLKVDERPAKIWDVYVSKDHKSLILVQLGGRFLMLDTAAKQVRELPAASLERKGKQLHGELPDLQAPELNSKLLATEDWSERSAGQLRIWKVRLSEEGRMLEVQLPQQGDLRKFY